MRPGRPGIARAGERMGFVEHSQRRRVEQGADDPGSHQDQGGLGGVGGVPALPGGGVQHRAQRGGRVLADLREAGELGPPDLDDVIVANADAGPQVPVPPGRPVDPYLVVDLGVRVGARGLVTVAMADAHVRHAPIAQHVDVLAGVRDVVLRPAG